MQSQNRFLSKIKGLSLEMIDFQDPELHVVLTSLFTEMKELDQGAMASSDVAVRIEKAIADRTNLKVDFTMHNDGGAYSLTPTIDKNNPLIENVLREFHTNSHTLKMIEKAGGAIRGSVNLATSKVSGVFAEMECVVNMPTFWVAGKFMGGGFTAGELSAITLHEIGHLFTFFEYMWHSVTTNQVLAAVARGLDESQDQNDRELLMISAAKALSLDETEMKKLADNGTNKAATVLIVKELTINARSELGADLYDMNNWEQLADMFAARHGAGRDLIIGMNKIDQLVGDISTRSTGKYLALEAVKALLFLSTAGFLILPGMQVVAVVPFLVWFAMILSDGPGSTLYDRPGVRLKRVRDQLVEQIKDRGLGKEIIERLKEDLVAVDKLLESVKDRFQLWSLMFAYLNSDSRNRLRQEKLQQELETLAANDLFVKAAELKTLF
jgi:hypothetical protein